MKEQQLLTTIINNPGLTFSRAPSSLDEPFKHFFSFPVSTLYTLKNAQKHTRVSFSSSFRAETTFFTIGGWRRQTQVFSIFFTWRFGPDRRWWRVSSMSPGPCRTASSSPPRDGSWRTSNPPPSGPRRMRRHNDSYTGNHGTEGECVLSAVYSVSTWIKLKRFIEVSTKNKQRGSNGTPWTIL